MAEPFTTSRLREAPAAEAAARLASRRKTADQGLRILDRLTMGLSVAHRARTEPLTARRAPQIIAEMLARRETDPPAGFAQFEIARLSEAMIVARTMMMRGNLPAMDDGSGSRANSTAIAASRRPEFPRPRSRPGGDSGRG